MTVAFFCVCVEAKSHKASSHRGATTYMIETAILTEDKTFDVLKSREITPLPQKIIFLLLLLFCLF